MSVSPKVLFLVGTVLGTSYVISQKIPSPPSPQLVLHHCFVVLEKTLESPLDCKEIQPVPLKEISPEYSLERLMLKLKLQYFGHLM